MKTLERLISKYLIKILYKFFSLFPIKKRMVFATHRDTQLNDNFKFIYDEMIQQDLDFEYVFLFKTMNKGIKGKLSYLLHLFKATFYLATSTFFLVEDFYFPIYVVKLRKGTEVIQTWHACGAFKKFGYSILGKEYGADNNYVKYIPIHQNYSHVLVSSKSVIDCYLDAFRCPKENILPIGIPRTDIFFNETLKEEAITRIYTQFPQLKGKRVILYAPTFRGATQKTIHGEMALDLDVFFEGLDEDTFLVLKMHPFIKEGNQTLMKKYKNLLDLTGYKNVNVLLLIADVLISDYSSLIFEYALLERPMIFFAYDKESYIHERDFYFSYESFVPARIVQTSEELKEELNRLQLSRYQAFDKEKIRNFKETFFDHFDGKSTERFINQVILKKN